MNEGALHIYKSSAGSGKTYTLVKTYLEILISSDDLFKFSKNNRIPPIESRRKAQLTIPSKL